MGGELQIEDEQVVRSRVDEVVCRWCGHGRSVVELSDEEHVEPGTASTAK